MKTDNLQQAVSGFNTVVVIGGPCVVRVHEALDCSYVHTPHRYFLSVDFRFRQCDALNIGNPGWLGVTKSEATREANALAKRIAVAHTAFSAAKEQLTRLDTPDNRYTLKLQAGAFDKIVGRYTSELNPA